MFDRNGQIVIVDESKKEYIKKKIISESLSDKGYRSILIAYADFYQE